MGLLCGVLPQLGWEQPDHVIAPLRERQVIGPEQHHLLFDPDRVRRPDALPLRPSAARPWTSAMMFRHRHRNSFPHGCCAARWPTGVSARGGHPARAFGGRDARPARGVLRARRAPGSWRSPGRTDLIEVMQCYEGGRGWSRGSLCVPGTTDGDGEPKVVGGGCAGSWAGIDRAGDRDFCRRVPRRVVRAGLPRVGDRRRLVRRPAARAPTDAGSRSSGSPVRGGHRARDRPAQPAGELARDRRSGGNVVRSPHGLQSARQASAHAAAAKPRPVLQPTVRRREGRAVSPRSRGAPTGNRADRAPSGRRPGTARPGRGIRRGRRAGDGRRRRVAGDRRDDRRGARPSVRLHPRGYPQPLCVGSRRRPRRRGGGVGRLRGWGRTRSTWRR